MLYQRILVKQICLPFAFKSFSLAVHMSRKVNGSIQNELLNDNTSIQEVSVITSSSHKDAVSSLAVEEKLLDIISDCTPAEREQILDALTFLKNWMRTAKEK